jgi:hypothetical protein
MKAFVIPADRAEPIREIDLSGDPGSDTMVIQEIVGGYFESPPVPEWVGEPGSVAAFCNERGKIQSLPVNTRATTLLSPSFIHDYICGDLVLTGHDDAGDICELPELALDAIEGLRIVSGEATG